MTDKVRVSLVFPRELWQRVCSVAPAGERSRLVAEATERELRRQLRLQSLTRLRALQEEWRHKYGEMPSSAEDLRQLREERDAELSGLR